MCAIPPCSTFGGLEHFRFTQDECLRLHSALASSSAGMASAWPRNFLARLKGNYVGNPLSIFPPIPIFRRERDSFNIFEPVWDGFHPRTSVAILQAGSGEGTEPLGLRPPAPKAGCPSIPPLPSLRNSISAPDHSRFLQQPSLCAKRSDDSLRPRAGLFPERLRGKNTGLCSRSHGVCGGALGFCPSSVRLQGEARRWFNRERIAASGLSENFGRIPVLSGWITGLIFSITTNERPFVCGFNSCGAIDGLYLAGLHIINLPLRLYAGGG